MSLFDRRIPEHHRQPRRYQCQHCEWFSYDPDETLGHMFTVHMNRRVQTVSPNPGRRIFDGQGPWLTRRQAAADNQEGVSRPNRRHN